MTVRVVAGIVTGVVVVVVVQIRTRRVEVNTDRDPGLGLRTNGNRTKDHIQTVQSLGPEVCLVHPILRLLCL